jgi:hypothetical protein
MRNSIILIATCNGQKYSCSIKADLKWLPLDAGNSEVCITPQQLNDVTIGNKHSIFRQWIPTAIDITEEAERLLEERLLEMG